ncbi:MAG: hypothetical protein ABI579_00105 [Candidatus Sumerlaeota bacterium]
MFKLAVWSVLLCASVAGAAVPVPHVIEEKRKIYDANQNANPSTGAKADWFTSLSSRTPVYHQWQVAEHGFTNLGGNQWLLVVMETNRVYHQSPGAQFVDAFNFVTWPAGFPDTIGTFQEDGYWRGNTLSSHDFVWAPFMFKEGGTIYMYYTAPHNGGLACFLATSSTGAGTPGAWVDFDANTSTPEIDPLFEGLGFRDFHVVKEGSEYRCYFIANPVDSGLGVQISEMRLRTSTSPTSFPDANEVATPSFRRINSDTRMDRLVVDYERPKVEKGDDGTYYLFICRHGGFPADMSTNPAWIPIPNATEVYFSSDNGLTFPAANQLPNLKTPLGKEIQSGEILHVGSKWYTTATLNSNDISTWPNDSCPDGFGNLTCHSPELTRVINTFEDDTDSIHIAEMQFTVSGVNSWYLY